MVSYKQALKDHKEVLHITEKCSMCERYMFGVFDSVIRDTCHECGGKHKIEYNLEENQENVSN